MGIGFGSRYCSDCSCEDRLVDKIVSRLSNKTWLKNLVAPCRPMPDPSNYEVIHYEEHGPFVILVVRYPDCTTFEGQKVLVFHGKPLTSILAQTRMDPHFSQSTVPGNGHPVARFEPTPMGMAMARHCCNLPLPARVRAEQEAIDKG
jgi:hypothetical protein